MPFPRDPNAPGGPSRAEQLRRAVTEAEQPTVTVMTRTTKGAWHTHVLPAFDKLEIERMELGL